MRCPKCDTLRPPGESARLCLRCGDRLYLDADGLARAARDPYIGTVVAGRFGLEAVIARGGMGVVYRAVQLPIGRAVAVKVLRRELFGTAADAALLHQRFRREAHIVSRLSHPNVVMLHDFGDCGDGNLFMAFELIEGPTLQEVLREGPLPPERALHIAIQLAAGLEEAHRHGIVHRDLKPGNVMLVREPDAPDETVKLVDFGIARGSDPDQDPGADDKVTLTGKLTGTPNYMSPEQIRGELVDARSDLYALGLIVHEMLSGRPAFTGRSPITIVMAQLNDPPPPLREVLGGRPLPPGLEEVVDQAVRKNRAERFARAADLRRALEGVVRRGELSALWADKGEEPRAVFAALRRHADDLVDVIVDDIRHTVEPYRTRVRSDVRARVGFFFAWCTQVAPTEAELSSFLVRVHRRGDFSDIRMADLISAFSLVFPALRSQVEGFEPGERALVQRHWATLERHFWLLLRIVTAHFEAVLSDASMDTWLDTSVIERGFEATAPDLQARQAREALRAVVQRRVVTVLSLGLVGPEGPGSAPDLDLEARPDEALRLLNRFLGGVAEAVTAERGLLQPFHRDGVQALFGAPVPHEDDALAASRAARAVREQVAALNAELDAEGQAPLRIVAALATGTAVVGHVGAGERLDYTALGEVVGRAERLRQRAAVGQILCDDDTAEAAGARLKAEAVVTAEGRAWRFV